MCEPWKRGKRDDTISKGKGKVEGFKGSIAATTTCGLGSLKKFIHSIGQMCFNCGDVWVTLLFIIEVLVRHINHWDQRMQRHSWTKCFWTLMPLVWWLRKQERQKGSTLSDRQNASKRNFLRSPRFFLPSRLFKIYGARNQISSHNKRGEGSLSWWYLSSFRK